MKSQDKYSQEVVDSLTRILEFSETQDLIEIVAQVIPNLSINVPKDTFTRRQEFMQFVTPIRNLIDTIKSEMEQTDSVLIKVRGLETPILPWSLMRAIEFLLDEKDRELKVETSTLDTREALELILSEVTGTYLTPIFVIPLEEIISMKVTSLKAIIFQLDMFNINVWEFLQLKWKCLDMPEIALPALFVPNVSGLVIPYIDFV